MAKITRSPADLPSDLEAGGSVIASGDALDRVLLTGELVAEPGEGLLADGTLSDVELTEVRCTGVRLSGWRLRGLRCVDVVFENCDLSGLIAEDSVFRRVEFHDCRLSGVVLAGSRFEDVLVQRAKLDLANLRMITASRLHVLGSDLREADLHGARLTAARLQDCDLSAADFTEALLDGTRLHGSTLRHLRGVTALSGTVIGSDQVLEMSTALFEAARVTVDDKP